MTLVYGLALGVLFWPLTIWVHQMAHIVAALTLTRGTVLVQWFGSPRSTFFASVVILGRLHFRRRSDAFLNPFPFYQFFVGYRRDADERRWRYVCVDLCGSVVGLGCASVATNVLFQASPASSHLLVIGSGLGLALPNVIALLPFRYPRWLRGCAGTPSDGQRLLGHMRDGADPALPIAYLAPDIKYAVLGDVPEPPALFWL